MTEEFAKNIENQFHNAEALHTPEAIFLAHKTAIEGMVDCQKKTAERIKSIEAIILEDHARSRDIYAILDTQKEIESRVKSIEIFIVESRARYEGAKWMARFLYSLGGVAGGAGVMKLLEILSK